MAIESVFALPRLTGNATAGQGSIAYANAALPALQGVAGAGEPLALPAITGSASALTGGLAESPKKGGPRNRQNTPTPIDLPALTGSATALIGGIASSEIALLALDGDAATAAASDTGLPPITGSASAASGVRLRSQVDLPALTGESATSSPFVASSPAELPALAGESIALVGSIGASRVTLASLLAASTAYTGRIASSTLALPILAAEGLAYQDNPPQSIVTLPAIIGTSTAGQVAGAAYEGYAVQMQRQALTRYSNVPLDGLAAFRGVYLACGPGGLFVLEGDDDDGALIAASARLALTDFGDPHLKRVDKLYLSYRSTGELALNVIVEGHAEYSYIVPQAHHETLTQGRVPLGRGARGAWWQFELANRDGADFTIDALATDPLLLSRKLG